MNKKFLLLALSSVVSTFAFAQILPLSRSPLFVRPAIDPNIILTFDDSGSMNLGITPNEIEGTYLPSGDAASQCFWRDYPHVYSAAANTQYYDPTITYAPPVYANNTSYPNAVFTGAYYDGFDAHRTGSENTSMPKRNLATDFAVSLYDEAPPAAPTACSPTPIPGRSQNAGTNGNLVTFGATSIAFCDERITWTNCAGVAQTTTQTYGGTRASVLAAPNNKRAFYYTFNNPNPIDPVTGKPFKPTTFQLYGNAGNNRQSASYGTAIAVLPAEETNFANWYSYYRTRTLMGRSASTRAFSQLPRNVRVGWQGLNSNQLNNTQIIKRIEDTTQRTNFYSYLNSVSTSGGTPTRSAMIRVGNYFSNNNTSGFTESNPYYDKNLANIIGSSNPATLISCRQNYHLIFTDGGWKDNVSGNPIVSNYGSSNFDQTNISNLPDTWQPSPLPNIVGKPYTVGEPNSRLYWNGPPQTRPTASGGYAAQANIGGFADFAFRYWATDLRTDLKNDVTPFLDDRSILVTNTTPRTLPANPLDDLEVFWNPKNDPATWQHLVHYVVAFGLQSSLNFPSDLDNLRGKLPVKDWTDWAYVEQSDPAVKVDDTWHGTLNSRGELLAASNPQELVQQLNSVFQAISARTTSVTAVSVSAGFLSAENFAFRTFFNASAWSGTVQGSQFINSLIPTLKWDAGCKLTGGICLALPSTPTFIAPDPMTGRKIYSSNGSVGVDFSWSQLNSIQQNQLNYNWDTGAQDGAPVPPETKSLGEKRLEYLRGVRTREGLDFRSRESVLGAVVHSNALYIKGPTDEYWKRNPNRPLFPNPPASNTNGPELKATFENVYVASIQNRPGTVYVGANDGMLHAFDAATGDERWAFVPNTGFRGLSRLTSKFNLFTQSSVDNTPVAREVFTNGAWRTLLIGSMRLGGQGVFALDVTDPNPTGGASKFLWEFNDSSPGGLDMGYSYGRPFITRVAAGNKWVVLVPGGYNSSDTEGGADTKVGSGTAVLFVLDAKDGSLIRKFDLGAGTVGLSTVVGGDYEFAAGAVSSPMKFIRLPPTKTLDEISDNAFAGDDNGSLWRFNLESSNPAAWSFVKFFQAPAGQRITTQPRIFDSRLGFAIVTFGTGRYVADPDRGDNNQQSYYGLYDPGPNFTGYPLTPTSLVEQTRTEVTVNGRVYVKTTDLPVSANKFGWFFKLGANGERGVADGSISGGGQTLVAPTFVPTRNPASANDPCVNDSASYLYFLDPVNGSPAARDGVGGFDVNLDGIVNDLDDQSVTGIQIIGDYISGTTPLTQAGGGQGTILLPGNGLGNANASAISTIAIPDYVWRRHSTREIPAWDANERK
jgi:type IV pilus assembly protein PilY1